MKKLGIVLHVYKNKNLHTFINIQRNELMSVIVTKRHPFSDNYNQIDYL